MSTKPVTDASFAEEVLGASGPVVVDFWATWCGPCKQIGPSLEELAAEYGDNVSIVKMDIDANPNTPGQYGVRGVPTLMLFNKGELVSTAVGAKPKSQIASWIEGAVATDGAVSA